MIFRCVALVFLLLLSCASAKAAKHVVIIGGGPNLYESQASIELNTQWLTDVLIRKDPEQQFHVFFTDGKRDGVDVRGWRPVEESKGALQPLARVFDWHVENGYFYYRSSGASEPKSADAEEVLMGLRKIIPTLKVGDELLLIYQGHGGYNASDTRKNSLRLWNNSSLTVDQLAAELDQLPKGVPIRFLFPQCFSGAFARLIYKDMAYENGLAAGPRCGFLAQDAHFESEGCTSSVNTDDYRDYTSYFFSALDGKNRNGQALAQNPDSNDDGIVTLREAHLYTLANAVSVDFSRSTIEDYLERWQPWYLSWLPAPSTMDNDYARVADELQERMSLQETGSALNREIATRIAKLNTTHQDLQTQRRVLVSEIDNYQARIRSALARFWPAIRTPYTAQYREILLNELDAVQDFILQHADYGNLVDAQERLSQVNEQMLNVERQIVQLRKIRRMQRLARLYAQFQRLANAREKADFETLVRCEDRPL
jgi:hypothetical protein